MVSFWLTPPPPSGGWRNMWTAPNWRLIWLKGELFCWHQNNILEKSTSVLLISSPKRLFPPATTTREPESKAQLCSLLNNIFEYFDLKMQLLPGSYHVRPSHPDLVAPIVNPHIGDSGVVKSSPCYHCVAGVQLEETTFYGECEMETVAVVVGWCLRAINPSVVFCKQFAIFMATSDPRAR